MHQESSSSPSVFRYIYTMHVHACVNHGLAKMLNILHSCFNWKPYCFQHLAPDPATKLTSLENCLKLLLIFVFNLVHVLGHKFRISWLDYG